ncbi:MAG: 50S ribosomal protein L4 [Candidatus Portnoybacteria bacterium CG06_land_8_20_14_3_00_39_12]|nr:MAG: 50S ribosomal protein L4 [Parcubacteria group bacterium CG1_02_40_25]PIU74976.1 MAG: 50S ribosomal protein L4 [Candidatus Portnoybacteria bacterium CG06_land_8_20_14_3_00_39_12]PJE58798.1 MAG: 50S ribosomal protein L4 [Candidatus Portnoybacteria bacterium CG10_big_fil_rev_8_21_14_0_10_40_22]
MKINTYNQKGEKISQVELPEQIFGLKMNQDLVHQAVVAQMANTRTVVGHAKNKGEVRGGGRKPWKQKGTGRARHGSIRSPLWKGGGVTFGPTPDRNFTKKINQKMKQKALFIALSSKVTDNEMVVLSNLQLEAPKTKNVSVTVNGLFNKIKPEAVFKKDRHEILLVMPKKDEEMQRASRNLPYLKMILADSLNIVDVLKYKYFLIVKDALAIIREHYNLKDKVKS